jgi:uncharacterized protein
MMQFDNSTLPRSLSNQLRDRLSQVPAVVLLGPRQVGKTTLARELAAHQSDSILLDLQRPADRAKLTNADLFLQSHRDRLVVLDEVQFMPELFAQLRPEIDAHRRPGRFLLLGSASGHLLAQSSESLAGRVSYLELTPFLASELMPAEAPVDLNLMQKLWLRGGFPQSFLSPSAETSYQWRADFIQTFIGRDLREMGVNVPVDTLFRFWRMLAHLHGQQFNASAIGASLGGVSHKVVATYLATLVDAMMVRKLEPHFVNLGKRLVKSPKIYVRDSGLLHALLGVPDVDTLMGHPSAGASWEGFCIEQICGQLPTGATVSYYRTAAGTELDLIVETGSKKVAFEIKFSNAPKVTKGFWQGLEDTGVDQAYIVAPVSEAWRLAANVEVVSPNLAAAVLK